jgi:hypothetical protein
LRGEYDGGDMARRASRRRLLTGSVPLAVALAGCSFRWGPEDDGDGTGAAGDGTGGGAPTTEDDGVTTTETPDPDLFRFLSVSSGDPTYRRWQPGTGDRRGVQDVAYNVAYARSFREDLPAAEYENATTRAMRDGYVGVEYEELDGVMVAPSAAVAVYVGTFERPDVTDRLAATPYRQFEATDGVDYYRWDRTGGTRFVAVGEEGVVAGPATRDVADPGETFRADAAALFDTAAGDRPTLREASPVYRRYTDAVGWPLAVWAGPPRFDDAVDVNLPGERAVPEDVAASVRVGAGRYTAGNALVDRYWLWTTETGPADPEAVRAAYDSREVRRAIRERRGDDTRDLAIRRDGRAVEVAVPTPVENAGGGRDPPLVAVDATLESTTLTVTHFAGDPLPLDLVTVRGAGDPIPLGDGELSPGESVAVDVPAAAETARVVYSPPAGDTTATVARV